MESNQSKTKVWIAHILQALIVLNFLMGAIMNIVGTEDTVKMGQEMGYAAASLPKLGIILLVMVLLYAIPRTNVLGALLLTAWLGGAVATHFIHLDPMTNKIVPAFFGVLVWLPLWLRDPRVSALLPLKKK